MAALPNPPVVPVEAYLNASYPDGDREYLDGVVTERNVGTPDHSALQKILVVHLAAFEKQLKIAVRPECRTRIEETWYRVADIVADISSASSEQSAGIDQVNKAVIQMEEITQQNAALVEEATAASQGMAQLAGASRLYGYGLRLEEVAKKWRGGCIIRSALLEPIRRAFHNRPDLKSLLLDPALKEMVTGDQADLRTVVCSAAAAGLPTPGLAACLAYFDAYRSGWLPANLVQAQRDYFGAHRYRRLDREGLFHTEWE